MTSSSRDPKHPAKTDDQNILRPSRCSRHWRVALSISIGTMALATAMSLLSELWWVFSLFEHPRPMYVVFLGFLVLVAKRIRAARLATIASVILLINIASIGWGTTFSAANSDRINLEIIHLNLDRDNHNAQAVIDAIQLADPQASIVCLQELTPAWVQRLNNQLPDYEWIESIPRNDSRGVGMLLHRNSLIEVANVDILQWLPMQTDRPTLAVQFRRSAAPFNTFTVLNLHTKRPSSSENFNLQRDELAAAAAWCSERIQSGRRTDAMIVIGDFNTTPWSSTYREFLTASGLQHVNGFGYTGTTYPGGWVWPLRLPIDLCAVSPDIGVAGVSAGPDTGSDHRPLTVQLDAP